MGNFAAFNIVSRSLVVAVTLTLFGCASSPASTIDSTSADETTASVFEATSQISPFLLQYVGAYDGVPGGEFDSVDLLRDGSFIAVVQGTRKTGRFAGPSAVPDDAPSIKVAFILGGDHFTATVTKDWTEHQQISLARQGVSEILTSTWNAGNEDMCDRSGGQWDDDDPDSNTGLFCTCPAPKVYIPSAGGCTN